MFSYNKKNSTGKGGFAAVVTTACFLSTVLFSSLRQNNSCHGFTSVSPIMKKSSSQFFRPQKTTIESMSRKSGSVSTTILQMGLDIVTYLRCEWISAALCSNQTPRSADVCLILACEDGRAVTFVPRSVETLITSTIEPDGIMPVSIERQLKQQEKIRRAGSVSIVNQRADDLKETEDESVDVCLSLQAAAKMKEKGLDWKKSVQEAARVLKSGGRLICVEQTMLDGQSYLEYVGNLGTMVVDDKKGNNEKTEDSNDEVYPTFECIGYDDVDLVLVPHIASVFVKSEDAGMTSQERATMEKNAEEDRFAELSLSAYERGIKKRKRRKKKNNVKNTTD